jgi:hypothetical protein
VRGGEEVGRNCVGEKHMTFEHWWSKRFEFKFGTRWLEPIAKHFAAVGWNAAIAAYKEKNT